MSTTYKYLLICFLVFKGHLSSAQTYPDSQEIRNNVFKIANAIESDFQSLQGPATPLGLLMCTTGTFTLHQVIRSLLKKTQAMRAQTDMMWSLYQVVPKRLQSKAILDGPSL